MTLLGTGTVTNGSALVTAWSGTALTSVTCPADSQIAINGLVYTIDSLVSTTSFSLTRVFSEGDDPSAIMEIDPFTSAETQVGTLNARTATLIQQLSLLDANGRGLFYNIHAATGANDPGPTWCATNNIDPELVDELYFDILDANNLDMSAIIDLWTVGTVLTFRSLETNGYSSWILTEAPSNQGPDEWRRINNVDFVASEGGGVVDGEAIAVEWNRAGSASSLGNPRGNYAGGTTYSKLDMVTDQNVMWMYYNVTPGAGNAPPTLPATANSHWQLVVGTPTVQDVLDELGVSSITISTSAPSGGSENDLWFEVPV